MKATYLLIKSSVLSVTDQQKPVYSDFSANSALDFSYEEKLEAFNESFIKVDNPEAFWNQADLPSALRVKMNMREREDGLYPAPDGIEFEVNAPCCKMNPTGCDDCINFNPLAVVSLIDAKEKEQSGEPGNEAKKEAVKKRTFVKEVSDYFNGGDADTAKLYDVAKFMERMFEDSNQQIQSLEEMCKQLHYIITHSRMLPLERTMQEHIEKYTELYNAYKKKEPLK